MTPPSEKSTTNYLQIHFKYTLKSTVESSDNLSLSPLILLKIIGVILQGNPASDVAGDPNHPVSLCIQ